MRILLVVLAYVAMVGVADAQGKVASLPPANIQIDRVPNPTPIALPQSHDYVIACTNKIALLKVVGGDETPLKDVPVQRGKLQMRRCEELPRSYLGVLRQTETRFSQMGARMVAIYTTVVLGRVVHATFIPGKEVTETADMESR